MPVLFRKADITDPMLEIARRLEPKLRRAYLQALQNMKGTIALDELAYALQTGDLNKVLSVLAIDKKFAKALNGNTYDEKIESFRDAVNQIFEEGGDRAAIELPQTAEVKMGFDLKNPKTLEFLNDYAFDSIKSISENTREGIRDVIADAFVNGGHPYEQARQIKQFIGLTANQSKAVLNYRKALSGSDTLNQALNRQLRDGRFDRSIQRAMRTNQGLSQTQIDKMVQRYQEKYIQYRAQTIARTESIRASNKGQRALWQQAVGNGLIDKAVKREWIVSGDDATCEDCLALDGMIVGLDEEFAPGILDPGDVHPDDRCSQALVFK